MDDTTTMVREAVARLLRDSVTAHRTIELEALGIDSLVWDEFGALGLRGHDTGMGVDVQMAVLQEIGRAGALVPFAESEVLGRMLAEAVGLRHGEATLGVVPVTLTADRLADGGVKLHLTGTAVPWGRHAMRVLALCRIGSQGYVADIEGASLDWEMRANLAAEPRDTVRATAIQVPASQLHELQLPFDGLFRTGALCRTAAMVGALSTVLDLAVQYAQDRKQFGKPISQFQIIQSYLAEMAAEVCAAAVAHDVAVAGVMAGDGSGDIAVAKLRAGQAANTVAKLAHQIHGAIGMTREYSLHVWTRRLWAWREEFGNETHWSRELGRSIIDEGELAFWPRVAGTALSLSQKSNA